MSINKAVQQIMIGSVCGSEEKALATLKAIKSAGYDSIELNGFMIKPTGFLVRALTKMAGMPTGSCGKFDWHKLTKESRLSVCSVHEDLGSIERDVNAVIEEAKSFNTDKVVITGMYRFAYSDREEVKKLAQRLNTSGEKLKENGISLLYHNHNVEFQSFAGGEHGYLMNCPYSILVNETNPGFVSFEFDSYWTNDSGVNPLDVMKLLGNRMKLYHVTDRGNRSQKPAMTPIIKNDSVELGLGNMNIEELITTAINNGAESVILETHKNWIDKNPIKSIEVSGEYLKRF